MLNQIKKPIKGEEIAIMKTNYGEIKFRLFPEVAPKAVENFATHSKDGYYNGLNFHRVIKDFMIQGGDPEGSGRGGTSIWNESFEDEFSPLYRNLKGALSMANSGPNTNGSQFFIVQKGDIEDNILEQMEKLGETKGFSDKVIQAYKEMGGAYWLDGKHTVFGQVYEGMDVVDRIANVKIGRNDMPKEPVLIEEIIIKEFKMDNIEDSILAQIKRTILNFENKEGISTRWKEPILGYADSADPLFNQLKEVAFEGHITPYDILKSAKTVVAYFLPFEDFVWKSNIDRRTTSVEWAKAYIETNLLIAQINDNLIKWFKDSGYKAAKLPPEKTMDYENLKSVWSNRHVAYIAGVGKFGLNNMLITEKGCCGRLGNIVTSLKIEPTQRTEKENCLFKYNNSCKICVDRCVNSALFIDDFNRFKCYQMCLENEDIYRDLGEASACGKCLVGLPCSSKNPVA